MSKVESAFKIYAELGQYLSDQPEPTLASIGESLVHATKRIEEGLANPLYARQVRSGVTSGMSQMISELPAITGRAVASEARRAEVWRTCVSIIEQHWPGHFKKYADKLQKILDRGRIKSNSEAEMIRSYLDIVEEQDGGESKFNELVLLLDAFGA